MNRCVVFDFDGVIINSHEVQKLALKTAYESFYKHSDPPYDAFFRHSGNSLENIFKQLELTQDMIDIYKRTSEKNIDLIKMNNGFTDLLKRIKTSDTKLALCTGKDRPRTLKILQKFNINHYFDIIVSSDDVSRPKPDAECLRLIMNELSVSENNMIMIGDSINDIFCAKNAKVVSIAVTWGDVGESDLKNQDPSVLVHTLRQLCIELENRNYISKVTS